ncbi:heavy-metal-associated domain-containing protein [Rhodococcus sp. NPDC003382]|uniref:heavy-metal-associated domain-containing protein n=1 Tax=unclassified Rhodococcus (in: high G+C Gram-positive bacteria) TaxID=192944 RepID=UPI0018CD09EA|nr:MULTISPECIES: heavy metal-associated domain-containing protein [unclassified Rhodococcus (in: high G+C Gram-positive bacteria)]MBH0118609.1 heavy-metal-associated domain-containing protein [Rhodococcus sp. CX]MCK8672606.1 heavy-metal-associated domain-containing protein [Rhodococcus sp. HM1]
MQNTYRVEGMTCGHCVSAVREEISAIPGVSEVDVNLETGTVVVVSDIELDPKAVADAVDEAGYALVA